MRSIVQLKPRRLIMSAIIWPSIDEHGSMALVEARSDSLLVNRSRVFKQCTSAQLTCESGTKTSIERRCIKPILGNTQFYNLSVNRIILPVRATYRFIIIYICLYNYCEQSDTRKCFRGYLQEPPNGHLSRIIMKPLFMDCFDTRVYDNQNLILYVIYLHILFRHRSHSAPV